MKVRLISINGKEVGQCEIDRLTKILIFSGQVFMQAFQQGAWVHYREVTAQRIQDIHMLDTSYHPQARTGEKI